MGDLVFKRLKEETLIDLLIDVEVIELNLDWKLKSGKQHGCIKISFKDYKNRFNSRKLFTRYFDTVKDSREAYKILKEEAKKAHEYLCTDDYDFIKFEGYLLKGTKEEVFYGNLLL